MERPDAIKMVRETLEKPFDKGRFINFSKNLFKHLDISSNFLWAGNRLPNAGAFQPHINSIERIGKSDVQSKSEDQMDVLIVNLKKDTLLERARTIQRNFVARYLEEKQRKAALVAFVPPDPANWRFSLVRMDYNIAQSPAGRLKIEKELTPARRYSFLVGENESSHTAQMQLLPILQDDERKPLLSDFEKAFNIKVVTKEFFEAYKGLVSDVQNGLEKLVEGDENLRRHFTEKEVDRESFAKKLMGQIVFLYFLQKKGWLGVAEDKKWGDGDKRFLRNLYERAAEKGSNFFNDCLEYLLYDALARPRKSVTPEFYPGFGCKIPFLNGGLFDPISDYDWENTHVMLTNKLFSNGDKTKEGDTGTGILDVFDRYNFTVREDEPLEKEVAIDPEMLGKVFEALEVTDRKSKGTYYTPREIVHYMCQESLINYLDTALNTGDMPLVAEKPVNLKLFGAPASQQQSLKTPGYTNRVPRDDIEALIHIGETVAEHEETAMRKLEDIEKGKQKTTKYGIRLGSIQENARKIDDCLKDITVCDPAAGSGAFLVGIMTEIVRARNVLTTYLADRDRDNYPVPQAEAWGMGDRPNPRPLPETGRGERGDGDGQQRGVAPTDRREDVRTSYTFKRHAIQSCLYGVDIDPGAVEIAKLRLWLSLVVDEEDIKQIDPLPNLDYKVVCGNSLLKFEPNVLHLALLDELEKAKLDYFGAIDKDKKDENRRKIKALLEKVHENDKGFNFAVDFSEVFPKNDTDRRGFDIVIANPPYVRQEGIKELKPNLSKYFVDCYDSTADIYVYFYQRGSQILKKNGTLTYISSNKYFRSGYGEKLRRFLGSNCQIHRIIDFGDAQVFEAIAYPSIIMLKNSRPEGNQAQVFTWTPGPALEEFAHVVESKSFPLAQEKLTSDGWRLESPAALRLLEKLRKAGKPLGEYVNGRFYYGIKTGLNEAFVVDRATRDRLIAEHKSSADLLKPMLRGRDVKRWRVEPQDLWIIFTRRGVGIKRYPAIEKYLAQYKKQLMPGVEGGRKPGSYEWYEIQDNIAYWAEFEQPKIVWGNLATEPKFAFADAGFHVCAPANLIVSDSKYLLGILNSKVTQYLVSQSAAERSGGFIEFKPMYIWPLAIPKQPEKEEISGVVDQILAITKDADYVGNTAKQARVKEMERQIDQMVYALYGLTGEEIRTIEGR